MSKLQKRLEYAKVALLYSTASRGFWKKRVSDLKKAVEEEMISRAKKLGKN